MQNSMLILYYSIIKLKMSRTVNTFFKFNCINKLSLFKESLYNISYEYYDVPLVRK